MDRSGSQLACAVPTRLWATKTSISVIGDDKELNITKTMTVLIVIISRESWHGMLVVDVPPVASTCGGARTPARLTGAPGRAGHTTVVVRTATRLPFPATHLRRLFMPPTAYIGEGGNIKSGCDVCGSITQSVCDSVWDNPRISRTAEGYFKFCVLIEG